MRRLLPALALALAVSFGSGCEQPVSAGDFRDGQVQLTDQGAFELSIFHAQGEPSVGANTFYLRVSAPDEDAGNGRGVPNVELEVAAATLDGSSFMDVPPQITYEGDGTYRVENLRFEAAGAWSIDFDLGFGSLSDHASFVFMVEG